MHLLKFEDSNSFEDDGSDPQLVKVSLYCSIAYIAYLLWEFNFGLI